MIVAIGATVAAMYGYAQTSGREEGVRSATLRQIDARLEALANDLKPIALDARQAQTKNVEQDARINEHERRLDRVERLEGQSKE